MKTKLTLNIDRSKVATLRSASERKSASAFRERLSAGRIKHGIPAPPKLPSQ